MRTTNPSKTPRTPKYMEFARQLREQVERGERKPGEQLPTFEQMRLEHGLSQGMLERVYSLLEEEGLIVREPGKGTFVAKPSTRVAVGVIGVVTCKNAEAHPYYTHLLQGVRETVRAADRELLLTSGKTPIKWEKMDGLLICSAYSTVVRNHLPPGMPHLSLLYHTNETPSVVTDDYQGIRQVMDHLLQLGHRRIAYLTLERSRPMLYAQERRLEGYREALREAGIEPESGWLRQLRDPFEPMQEWQMLGHQKTQRWLESDWNENGCTAILAHNDETAIGVIEALQEAGLRVPEDVSVVGFDGTEIARYFRPRLTTLEVPLRELGARGAQLLLDAVSQSLDNSHPLPPQTLLPVRLKVGDSTAPVKS